MITIIGDVMVDVVVHLDAPLSPESDTPARTSLATGGSAAGTAAWLAHDGHEVRLVAAIGLDSLGTIAAQGLQSWGLQPHQVHLIPVDGQATGTCVVVVDSAGRRSMLTDPGANAALTVEPGVLEGATHLHVSGYSLMRPASAPSVRALLAHARARGLTTSLGLASSAPVSMHRRELLDALTDVDLVFANADEARALTGQPDERALDAMAAHAPCVVITRGPLGCTAARGAARVDQPAPASGATDTTGAGDALAAGFLPAWRAGAPLADCVAAGQSSASRALGRVGAGPPPATGRQSPPDAPRP